MYLNKAIIIGNLTRDPEMKALPSGIKVTSFSLATNRVWKDKEGQKQESTDYHNIVVFGRQAETVAQYLKKGSSALVEGRMQTRSWDGPDGTKRYRTEVVADRIQFGPRREGGSSSAPEASKQEPKDGGETGGIDYPQEEINPDDIPF
ncbi:MAG: single-stranded DNA-binding protein [Patescibacteria group bacterium]